MLRQGEIEQELYRILGFWRDRMTDHEHGGFYGALDESGRVRAGAAKGGVLNARILWTFSAAYLFDGDHAWLKLAERAYRYLLRHFIDVPHGGIHWSVSSLGEPLETRKQVYAQAFAIYAFSEYYRCTGRQAVLEQAVRLYKLVEQHSHDPRHKGYYEAFARDWGPVTDPRLSEKDEPAPKTMNTHLHLLEAYTNLYRVWPDKQLRERLHELIQVFTGPMTDTRTRHLILFFDENWQKPSTLISYGHDIEASWLLIETVKTLGDRALFPQVNRLSLDLAGAASEGLDNNGGLHYEHEPLAGHLNTEKHWWVQAEAVIGFFNAWQLSGHAPYLDYARACWTFIKTHLADYRQGEWHWGLDASGQPMAGQDKAGFWKCPYHNTRMCLEVLRRI